MPKPAKRQLPWWHDFEVPHFPPAPWDLARVDTGEAVSWLITSELRGLENPPVAIVPHASAELEDEQRGAAHLIAAAPQLFMGAAALVKLLEDGRHIDAPTRRALEFVEHALDVARGRG